jgi:hypothetical protein
MDFDKWFSAQGYNDELRVVFRAVWEALQEHTRRNPPKLATAWFTTEQMIEYAREAAADECRRCAMVCLKYAEEQAEHEGYEGNEGCTDQRMAAQACAEAILAQLGGAQ